MRPANRQGFSLLEIMIALGLFVLILTAVLQTMTGTTTYVTDEATRGDMDLTQQALINEMTNDLGNSAWYYSYPSTTPLFPVTTADVTTPAQQQCDQIEFIKLRTSLTVVASPLKEHSFHPNFDAATPVVQLSNYGTSMPEPFLVLNTAYVDGSTTPMVAPSWETYPGGATDFATNNSPDNLRHYRYVVVDLKGVLVPLTGAKTGPKPWRLLRQYKNGLAGAWTHAGEPEMVLANNVSSVKFAVSATFANNQVKISVLLQNTPNPSNPNVIDQRQVDLTTAMRSVSRSQ